MNARHGGRVAQGKRVLQWQQFGLHESAFVFD